MLDWTDWMAAMKGVIYSILDADETGRIHEVPCKILFFESFKWSKRETNFLNDDKTVPLSEECC